MLKRRSTETKAPGKPKLNPRSTSKRRSAAEFGRRPKKSGQRTVSTQSVESLDIPPSLAPTLAQSLQQSTHCSFTVDSHKPTGTPTSTKQPSTKQGRLVKQPPSRSDSSPFPAHNQPHNNLSLAAIAAAMGYKSPLFSQSNESSFGLHKSLRSLPVHQLLLSQPQQFPSLNKSSLLSSIQASRPGVPNPRPQQTSRASITTKPPSPQLAPSVQSTRPTLDQVQLRTKQRLRNHLETTMPVVKKQLVQFTTSQSISSPPHTPEPLKIFNPDGSITPNAKSQLPSITSRTRNRSRVLKRQHKPTTTATHKRLHSTSSSPYQSQSQSQSQYQQQSHYTTHQSTIPQRKTAFQRLLPHINKLSQILTPRVKKLASYVRTGAVKLTGPLIDLMSKHIVPPIGTSVQRLGDHGDQLLSWVDAQIAKRGDIPVEQISAIRTQVVAITANSIVAISKAVAAYFSNSGVMLAEALHSLADLSNQSLLLFGTTKALRDSDDVHPYGYATAKYIYGVLSASGVFFISCALTMYHAITQYFDTTHSVDVTLLTVVVLGISFIVEGYSQYAAYKSIKELAAKDEMTFMEYIRGGRETTSIAIFVEDSIAILGLIIAITTTALTHIYQNNIYDTIGTGCIGLAMGFVAYFLFHRNESYVLGTSFSPEEKGELLQALKSRPAVTAVHDLKAVAYGESDCRVKAEVVFNGKIIAKQVLDQNKLIPVTLPFKEVKSGVDGSGETTATETQSMLIGPDGTLAGNQILYHLTKSAGLSTDHATQLLLRFGGECVSEVARETDQVEKHTKALFPEVTHLDLECHSSHPLEDFTSENFVYPYLAKHRKAEAMIASAKRANKSRAWTVAAKTNFRSLQQAMRGQHDVFTQVQVNNHPSSRPGPVQHPYLVSNPTTSNPNQHQQPTLAPHQHVQHPMNTVAPMYNLNSQPQLQSPHSPLQPQTQRLQQPPSTQHQQHQHHQQHQQHHHQHQHQQQQQQQQQQQFQQHPHLHQYQQQQQQFTAPTIPARLNTTQFQQTTQPPQQRLPFVQGTYQSTDEMLDELTRDINLSDHTLPTSEVFHGVPSLTDSTIPYHSIRLGRYDKPVPAQELVRNDVYKEVLNRYKNLYGEIDSSMTLFPMDDYSDMVLDQSDTSQDDQQSPRQSIQSNNEPKTMTTPTMPSSPTTTTETTPSSTPPTPPPTTQVH